MFIRDTVQSKLLRTLPVFVTSLEHRSVSSQRFNFCFTGLYLLVICRFDEKKRVCSRSCDENRLIVLSYRIRTKNRNKSSSFYTFVLFQVCGQDYENRTSTQITHKLPARHFKEVSKFLLHSSWCSCPIVRESGCFWFHNYVIHRLRN